MIDRLNFAKAMCAGKRVVDIGGSRMQPDARSKFDLEYLKIQQSASSYTVVDLHDSADVVVDLNNPNNLDDVLSGADVILCMETLEHLRNPGLVCDAIRCAVNKGALAYITLPKSSAFYRYIERNGLGNFWGKCSHLYSFPDYHAEVFMRHNFNGCKISKQSCLSTYSLLWPLVYLATFGAGLSHGFLVEK